MRTNGTPDGRPYGAGEQRIAPGALPEKYLRCLWYDGRQFLKRGIRTRDGRIVRVVSPGSWNTGRGPDFLDGIFQIGRGGTVCGDVEVHRRRHDWHRHAHRRDPVFGGVRFHVFLLDDGNGDRCENCSGGPMTEICLRGQTRRGLERAARAIDPRRYPYRAGAVRGRCGEAARNGGGEGMARFLRAAGEARLREKAARARRLLRRHGIEDALYRLILETLGYSAHKDAFIRLAELLPWRTLRRVARRVPEARRREAVESALMGAAGLIPAVPQPGWDAGTVRAWKRTRRIREEAGHSPGPGELPAWVWRGAAQRPANSPSRRIAGISPLLAGCAREGLRALVRAAGLRAAPGGSAPGGMDPGAGGAGQDAALRTLQERLDGFLDGGVSPYWRTRCSWGGAKLRAPLSLIGREHRLKIIANVLLPVLYAGGAGDAAVAILNALPAVEPDSRVKTMMTRLVGGGAQFPRRWGMAAQQGMLHVHRHYCAKDRTGCRHCRLPELIARFPSLPRRGPKAPLQDCPVPGMLSGRKS